MLKKVCITFSGKNQSGKDFAADYLITKFGFKKYSFADPIKDFYKKALPDIDYHNNPEGRNVFIELAEAPKRIDPYCWAFNLTERIVSDYFPNRIIIPDLRYSEECEHLDGTLPAVDFGGGYKIVKVHIISNLSDKYIDDLKKNNENLDLIDEIESDKSNNEYLGFNFNKIIENNYSIDKLYKRLTELVATSL
jgi:dephospho-CoA kinase